MLKKKKVEIGLRALKERRGKKLVLFALPPLIYIMIFSYLPLWGWSYAFVDYKVGMRSPLDAEFVGLKNFAILFKNPVIRDNALRSIINTLGMFGIGLVLSVLPMMFAIFLNELKSVPFKKVVQTVSTLPHFIGWVTMFTFVSSLFSTNGAVNTLFMDWGIIEKPINILTTDKHVWLIQELLQQWKGVGWSSIVFFSALAGIDQEMVEAAMVDGAGRMKRIWYIILPHLMETYVVLMIMSMAKVLSTGITQYMIFENAMNKDHIETLDLYVYHLGISDGRVSYGTAIGMMKSAVALIMFFSANYIAKKVRGRGIA